jgi:hypothetical protein
MAAPVTPSYFDIIARQESGRSLPLSDPARYATTNPYDYLGKYQMGTAALVAAGLYNGFIYNSSRVPSLSPGLTS